MVIELRRVTTSDKETAEVLNEFFQSVFVKEEDSDIIAFNDFARLSFDTEVSEPFDYIGVVARNVLESIEIDRSKVIKALKALDPNKTPGPDGLHPKVLMEVADQIGEPVHMIFVDSLTSCSLPNWWVLANITALY